MEVLRHLWQEFGGGRHLNLRRHAPCDVHATHSQGEFICTPVRLIVAREAPARCARSLPSRSLLPSRPVLVALRHRRAQCRRAKVELLHPALPGR